MTCAACGAENESGRKFCGECGTPLARACPSCGAPNAPGVEVLRRVRGGARSRRAVGTPPAPAAPGSRAPARLRPLRRPRRLHDALGERDAEEVRELLSRYFDTRGRLIERYGGTVEKFIGDAVMAVWGTPTAHRGRRRARRARRARPRRRRLRARRRGRRAELRARAGVLTGEAAVTLGAEGQGMVAGDLVNTASRIQSAAEPGTVLVGEATRRATEQRSPTRTPATHELKGKDEPMPLWRALRVVAGSARRAQVGGARGAVRRPRPRAAPRQGALPRLRRRDARRTSSRSPASPASASRGSPGSSTSTSTASPTTSAGTAAAASPTARASPTGRSPTWCACAAESPRTRTPASARCEAATRRSRSTSSTPRSAPGSSRGSRTCSGSASATAARPARTSSPPGASSSSASPSRYPTVLVFEDMQWADASLLDFVEYLLEWSRQPPDLRAHARAAGARRAAADLGRRAAQLHVALPRAARRRRRWRSCWPGSCPGLPDDVRDRSSRRAEGVPLYAVETVRMLLDRGLLVQEGDVYRSTGDRSTALEVPETLHALIAVAARRPVAGGAPPAPGRGGARQDVHDARRSQRSRARRGRARAARSRALVRKEVLGVAGRPALARARPVRLPPGPRAPRRLRDAREARAPSAATSPPPRYLALRTPDDGRDRRGDRLALPRRLRGRPRRGRRRRGAGGGAQLVPRAAERAASLAASSRRSGPSSAPPGWPTTASSGAIARPRGRAREDGRSDGGGRAAARGGDRHPRRVATAGRGGQRTGVPRRGPVRDRPHRERRRAARACAGRARGGGRRGGDRARVGSARTVPVLRGTRRRRDAARRAGARARRAPPTRARRRPGAEHQGADPPAPTQREPRADAPGAPPGGGGGRPRRHAGLHEPQLPPLARRAETPRPRP